MERYLVRSIPVRRFLGPKALARAAEVDVGLIASNVAGPQTT
jgi:hypothetical protein